MAGIRNIHKVVKKKKCVPVLVMRRRKKLNLLCEWCKKQAATHTFSTPQLELCCECVEIAIENSVFFVLPGMQGEEVCVGN